MSRQSSELGYYVRGAAREVTGQGPNSSARARNVSNNLDHLHDQATQTHATIAAKTGANWTQATTTVGTYLQLVDIPPIPILPLRRAPDGSSVRLVITVAGYCVAVGKTSTLLFALNPLRPGALPSPPVEGRPTVATIQFGSTAVSTKSTTVYVSRMGETWLLPAVGRDSQGALVSVRMYAGQLEPWATGDDPTAHVVIESITVRAWVG